MSKNLLYLLIFISLTVIGQQNEEQVSAKISKIQQKLKVLQGKLNSAYGQEKVLIEQLEQQDRQINLVANKVIVSTEHLNIIKNKVTALNTETQQKENSIFEQKSQIITLLKLQVYLNHDKTLKMLLVNPNNKANNQAKHQIKYRHNKLYKLIEEVSVEIKVLHGLQAEQLLLASQENKKQQLLLAQQDELLEQRKHRFTLLKNLKVEIGKHETESDGLNQDQKRLALLINEVKNLLSDLPDSLGENKPFRKLKGKMHKPVEGKYIRSFRSRRSAGTRWNGVVIKSEIGTQIQSIAYGRVAFADWLRGFGMLIIIDHQDGYMSLYGFNESISVEVGDWVDSKQNIATIGSSGTLATPALYFEIRKDAQPLNPKKWVK